MPLLGLGGGDRKRGAWVGGGRGVEEGERRDENWMRSWERRGREEGDEGQWGERRATGERQGRGGEAGGGGGEEGREEGDGGEGGRGRRGRRGRALRRGCRSRFCASRLLSFMPPPGYLLPDQSKPPSFGVQPQAALHHPALRSLHSLFPTSLPWSKWLPSWGCPSTIFLINS